MALYQLTQFASTILREADNAYIPNDPANRDYQDYLAWLAVPNTPDPAPVPAPSTTIGTAAFMARFTPAEQIAIQTAASANPQIGFGLTLGLAQGYIILTSPILANWLAGLVAAGAITSARATVVSTP